MIVNICCSRCSELGANEGEECNRCGLHGHGSGLILVSIWGVVLLLVIFLVVLILIFSFIVSHVWIDWCVDRQFVEGVYLQEIFVCDVDLVVDSINAHFAFVPFVEDLMERRACAVVCVGEDINLQTIWIAGERGVRVHGCIKAIVGLLKGCVILLQLGDIVVNLGHVSFELSDL